MTYYINEKQIEQINRMAIERYSPGEEVRTVNHSALNMIVNLPEQFVFGKPLYPTIFDKATILYVQLIKKHVFVNANKRTAFFALLKFLRMNGFALNVPSDQAIEMTIEIAVEPLTDENLARYKKWISDHTYKI